jgi:hypothetical protein
MMAEATVYRALKRLRRLRLIYVINRIQKKHNGRVMFRGGPRAVLYGLPDASVNQINDAVERYYNYRRQEV